MSPLQLFPPCLYLSGRSYPFSSGLLALNAIIPGRASEIGIRLPAIIVLAVLLSSAFAVMMGLKGDGMYNPGDYEFTRSFDDKEEQKAALLDEIGIRIKDRGFHGMVSLFTTKSEICFGDGTYGLSDCLGGIRDHDSKLHAWILSEGRHYSVYKHVCTGVLLALYVLVIVSGLQEVLCTGSDSFQYLAPRLAVFGLLLFLMCWEARWRYFSSFIPMIFVSALLGMDTFSNLLQRIRCRMIHSKKSSLAETVG